jgi:predicted metal-dependent peptidase
MNTSTPSEIKFRLLNKTPFFGTVLFSLPIVEDESIPTAGVDGVKLYYNPKFWDSLTYKQKLGVLLHEVGHLVLNHPWRRKNREEVVGNPKTGDMASLWNVACDYAVNDLIVQALGDMQRRGDVKNLPELPKPFLWDQKYHNWAAEQIYDDLKKNMKKMTPQQQQQFMKSISDAKGKGGDHSKWEKLKGSAKTKAQARMKQITQQAAEFAKQKGDVPSGLDRLFEELEPKENWRELLLQYVQPYSNDYSFNPSDRRYLESDFILPDLQDGEKLDWIAIAIDTSGSIGQNELNHFLSEVKAILEAFDQVRVKVTFCDAEASPFAELEEWNPDQVHVTGGGGTDFRPVFDLVTKEETAPMALFYFTDMMGEFPDKAPDYDLNWVRTMPGEAPFGKVLDYNI